MKVLIACEFSGIVRDAFIAHRRRAGLYWEGEDRDDPDAAV